MATPRATAQYLLDVRSDAALRRTLAQSAQSDAAKFFDVERFVRQYRSLYSAQLRPQPIFAKY
jgi:hypothetical protein